MLDRTHQQRRRFPSWATAERAALDTAYAGHVTAAGVPKLQQALPNCYIEWSPPPPPAPLKPFAHASPVVPMAVAV